MLVHSNNPTLEVVLDLVGPYFCNTLAGLITEKTVIGFVQFAR